jgi:hypothetical protein
MVSLGRRLGKEALRAPVPYGHIEKASLHALNLRRLQPASRPSGGFSSSAFANGSQEWSVLTNFWNRQLRESSKNATAISEPKESKGQR